MGYRPLDEGRTDKIRDTARFVVSGLKDTHIWQLTHSPYRKHFIRKCLWNGNWRKLRRVKKALYRAALWYSRVRGAIMNENLVGKLSVLVDKLKETSGARVFRR